MVPVVPGSHPWASRTGAHQGLEMCTLVQYQTKASGLLCAALSVRVCACVERVVLPSLCVHYS